VRIGPGGQRRRDKKMKIIRHCLIITAAAFLLPAVVGSGSAETDDSAPIIQPVDSAVYDWYNLGELFAASRSFDYNRALAEHLDDVYAPLGDLLARVQASKETVAAFSDWLAQLERLPWRQPFGSWLKQDQVTWQVSPEQQRFSEALEKDAARTPECRFFFLLGARTEELVWTVSPAATRKLTVVVNGSIKRAGHDFRLLISDPQLEPLFGKLSPPVQQAIKLVIDLAEAEFGYEDPKQVNAEPLSMEEIQQVVDAGTLIRRCAKMRALLPVPDGMSLGKTGFAPC